MATVTKPPVLDETGQDILTQLRRIADAKESNLMGYGGAVLFASLPSPTTSNLGLFYLIQDAFTTTSDFVVGSGISEPAGKYWAVINIGTNAAPVCKYDEMGALIDLSSKQDKIMSSPVVVHGVSQAQVEGAINAINTGTGSLANLTTTDKTNLVAAINEAASTGGGGTVDQTYKPTSTNAQSGTAVAGAVSDLYSTGDTAETTLADNDYVPFYDTSVTGKRKSTWSNIKSVLKNYFDGYYSAVKTSKPAASGGTDLSLVTTGEKNTWNNKIADNPSFTQAGSRANIASGESFSTLFGKIMKWFADLKDLAFISKPTSGQTTTWLRGDGTWVAPPNDNTWTAMVGATSNANGTAGYVGVNPPSNGYNTKYWRADGTWTVPPNNNTIPTVYCDTAAGTQAKVGQCTNYNLLSNSYINVIIVNTNTYVGAITLNVNNKGAKPIYINGTASSSTNNALTAGSYLVYYNGTNYYFRKDGKITSLGIVNTNNTEIYNERRVRRILDGSNVPSGTTTSTTGIGTWTDKDVSQIVSSDETDWWYDSAFIIPNNIDQNSVDISFKFDPSGDTVTLGGYIFDSSTGKICIKFGNSVEITNTRIAVDITYQSSEVG